MQKIYRLSSNASFNYIYNRGKSVSAKDLILLFVPTKYSFKVGFTVSKKVGKAVVRNKTKRRLKNGFITIIPRINRSYNYIFVAKSGAAEQNYNELLRQMLYLLKKAGLLS